MDKPGNPAKFSPEMRERAVRMVFEHSSRIFLPWATIGSIAPKIGCTPQTLLNWVRRVERDQGLRPGPASEERERIKALERENRELRLRKASAYLPWRNSTAGRKHDRVHRRSP